MILSPGFTQDKTNTKQSSIQVNPSQLPQTQLIFCFQLFIYPQQLNILQQSNYFQPQFAQFALQVLLVHDIFPNVQINMNSECFSYVFLQTKITVLLYYDAIFLFQLKKVVTVTQTEKQALSQNQVFREELNKTMKIEISIFLSNQSFLFIIQKMRSQKNRASFSSCVSNLRHKCSNFQNQLPRLSFAYNYKSPLFFVEKQAANLKRFSVIHAQALQNLAFLQKDQIAQLQRPRTRKLKESLNALELKISQANKQLRRWPEALENEQSDEESNTNLAQQLQSGTKEQILSTNYSSIGKISFNQSHTTLNCFQQLKTYYLSHIQQAIQGKNSRALEHLNLSLKILHNRYKIGTPTFSQLDKLKVSLAKNSSDMGKKTLLLDIDQTLLRCQYDNSKAYDIALPIPTEGGGKATAFISFRPYAISFLKRMSKIFEIVAFTAAHQDYADRVLDQIDPKRQYIKHRLYRKNCFEIYQNIYAKDLRIINRELSDMVLVDNSPFSYIYQLDNAIPILPYLGGEDNQLIQLQKYLELVAKCADVRGLNKATFKFHLFYLFRAVEDLARTLYQA